MQVGTGGEDICGGIVVVWVVNRAALRMSVSVEQKGKYCEKEGERGEWGAFTVQFTR